jgi:hydrogenase nickel incorporation protein HypB
MTTVRVIANILEANDRIAAQNAALFSSAKLWVANLMGAPGAGKTSLLERTIDLLTNDSIRLGVIEGDIQGSVDAERVSRKGVQAVQINTALSDGNIWGADDFDHGVDPLAGKRWQLGPANQRGEAQK